jgi:tetrahydromethanopterin S-methyltransferase subunit F
MITAGWYGETMAGNGKEGKMEFVIGVLVAVVLVFVILYLAKRT